MKLKIITLKGEERIIECNSFEFRSNQVTNWIKLYEDDGIEIIHNVAVIRTLTQRNKQRWLKEKSMEGGKTIIRSS